MTFERDICFIMRVSFDNVTRSKKGKGQDCWTNAVEFQYGN